MPLSTTPNRPAVRPAGGRRRWVLESLLHGLPPKRASEADEACASPIRTPWKVPGAPRTAAESGCWIAPWALPARGSFVPTDGGGGDPGEPRSARTSTRTTQGPARLPQPSTDRQPNKVAVGKRHASTGRAGRRPLDSVGMQAEWVRYSTEAPAKGVTPIAPGDPLRQRGPLGGHWPPWCVAGHKRRVASVGRTTGFVDSGVWNKHPTAAARAASSRMTRSEARWPLRATWPPGGCHMCLGSPWCPSCQWQPHESTHTCQRTCQLKWNQVLDGGRRGSDLPKQHERGSSAERTLRGRGRSAGRGRSRRGPDLAGVGGAVPVRSAATLGLSPKGADT